MSCSRLALKCGIWNGSRLFLTDSDFFLSYLHRHMLKLPGDDSFCKEFRQMDRYRDNVMYEYISDSTVISYITNHRDQKAYTMTVGASKLPIMFDFGYAWVWLRSFRRLSARLIQKHYENKPIQIYRKFHLQKQKKIQIKTLIFFIFLLKT